jgi:hypothetical protein
MYFSVKLADPPDRGGGDLSAMRGDYQRLVTIFLRV